MVKQSEEYRWSSAQAHVQERQGDILSGKCYLSEDIKNWRKYLREVEDSSLVETIKKNALTGRPCGDDRFVAKLERKFKRRLSPLAHGRPREKGKGK